MQLKRKYPILYLYQLARDEFFCLRILDFKIFNRYSENNIATCLLPYAIHQKWRELLIDIDEMVGVGKQIKLFQVFALFCFF